MNEKYSLLLIQSTASPPAHTHTQREREWYELVELAGIVRLTGAVEARNNGYSIISAVKVCLIDSAFRHIIPKHLVLTGEREREREGSELS